MEWLFKKMLETPGVSYSPEKVKQILDAHQIAIERIFILMAILCAFCMIYIIINEIKFHRIKKNFKKD